MIYETIYNKLYALIPDLDEVDESVKLKAEGFMDLSVEILSRELNQTVIALAHYYEQNGDPVPDPDMEVAIYPEMKMAEALAYQDRFKYQRVYPSEGKVDIRAKRDLNQFLDTWLSSLLRQGHRVSKRHQ